MTQRVRRPRAFKTPAKKYELTSRGFEELSRVMPRGSRLGDPLSVARMVIRAISKSADGRLTARGIRIKVSNVISTDGVNKGISSAITQGLIV